jgi:hypothetical protein
MWNMMAKKLAMRRQSPVMAKPGMQPMNMGMGGMPKDLSMATQGAMPQMQSELSKPMPTDVSALANLLGGQRLRGGMGGMKKG